MGVIKLDIKRLHYFLTIAKEGQITRASKKLHMAQPPLSNHLKSLEQELGVTSFERNTRKLELTPAGKILLRRTEELFQHLDETYIEVKEAEEGIRGELTIGFLRSCFSYLPERIKLFQKKYPSVKFKLREGDPYQIGELLRSKEIDIGIARLPMELNDLSVVHLPKEQFVVIAPIQWGINNLKINIEQLKDYPFLLSHRVKGVGMYDMLVEECNRHGFHPDIVCECPDSYTILSLVASGVGISIIPKLTLNSFNLEGIHVIELDDFPHVSEPVVTWLKERYVSKSMEKFLDTFSGSNS